MNQLDSVRTQSVFSKADLYVMYDNVDRKTFDAWMEPIKAEIGWRKGKQVFPPKVVLRIIEHIGQPIAVKFLNV